MTTRTYGKGVTDLVSLLWDTTPVHYQLSDVKKRLKMQVRTERTCILS